MRRQRERGYALIMSAIAVLFLATAASVIVYASTTGRVTAVYEVDQVQASLTAQAGAEWVIGVAKTGWLAPMTRSFPNDSGSMTVERTGYKNRSVRTTGRRGTAQRQCISEFALFYVPASRHAGTNADVVFEVFNMTGTDVLWSGLIPVLGTTAFFEEVRVKVFSNAAAGATPNTIDYGPVWTYTAQGGGLRAGTGATLTFNQTATIANGRQALVQLRGFKAAAGGGAAIDMDVFELLLTPREGAVNMPGIPIPRVE